jgi:glucose-1-phosphate adenylyltransferase
MAITAILHAATPWLSGALSDRECSKLNFSLPIAPASAFGVMATGSASKLSDFQEKPERPVPTAAGPGRASASMGNYLFNPRVLRELLDRANRGSNTDFGHHILPRLPHSHRVFAYDFASNRIPGVRHQEERGYWCDIGTVDAYRAAQRDAWSRWPMLNARPGSDDVYPFR